MKRYINAVKTLLNIANDKFSVVIQLFISCALYNLSSLLPPITTAGIIAQITNNNFNGIWIYVLLYLIFYCVYFSMLNWNYNCYKILGDYYHLEVQKKIFDHIANNSSIVQKISKGKIVDTCSEDVKCLVDVIDSSAEALVRFIELIVIFLIFAYYNLFVAIVVIILDLVYLKIMSDNSKKVSKYYEGTRKYQDKIIDVLNQSIISLKQIKSLNIMPSLNKKLDKTRAKWKEQYKQRRDALTSRYTKMPYIVYIGKIFLYIFLGYLVVNRKMSIDKLILLISYFEMAITCTDKMLDYLLDLSNYGVRVSRIQTILGYTSNDNIDFGEIDNDYINGTISFSNVNYNIKNKPILKNISFKIYPNEINAIVGHSGSGKTTIVNLLYRLDRIKSGSILIDNESIYNYSKGVYNSNVSGVFQKPFIFDMSIKDNFSLVDSNKDNQIEACKRIGIHDFIMSLPNGYNTIISEESNFITDGQKQLISIARAVLSKAEILILDEVTSNIGPGTTQEVIKILNDLKQDHTIIMVTHKPEMMEIADRVIVLDNGKVVAKGLNEDVLNKCSLYKELKNRTFASVSTNDI